MSAPLDIPSLIMMCTSGELQRLMRTYSKAANDDNGFGLHNHQTDADRATIAATLLQDDDTPPLVPAGPDQVALTTNPCLSLTPMLVFSQAKGEPTQ